MWESNGASVISLNGTPDHHGSVHWPLCDIYLKNHNIADIHNVQSLKKIFNISTLFITEHKKHKNLNKSQHRVHSPLQLPDQAESCRSFLSSVFPHRNLLTQHCHFSISTFLSASTQQIVDEIHSLWSHKPLITLVCCSKSSPS